MSYPLERLLPRSSIALSILLSILVLNFQTLLKMGSLPNLHELEEIERRREKRREREQREQMREQRARDSSRERERMALFAQRKVS